MREIKFRGKSTHNGEWVYGYVIFTDTRAFIQPHSDGLDFSDCDFGYGFTEVVKDTVGQFTGVLDKNCKEVYAGDNVKLARSLGYQSNRGDIGTVEYDDSELGYLINAGYPLSRLTLARAKYIEVIGNIHESK